MTQHTAQLVPAAKRGGRPAAGTDPRKRLQILEGAQRVFQNLGFDAASMSDVAREAQVSKATLYVYFEDKEHLFSAICADQRDRNINELIALLDPKAPLKTVLATLGADLIRRISQPHVIAAHRIVIGVAERMPEIGRDFYESGAMRMARSLAAFFTEHIQQGRLQVEDPERAAVQFFELCLAGVLRPRLYGVVTGVATEEEIEVAVSSAVRVFMAAYGPR